MGQVCGADVEIKAAAVGDGETLQVGVSSGGGKGLVSPIDQQAERVNGENEEIVSPLQDCPATLITVERCC